MLEGDIRDARLSSEVGWKIIEIDGTEVTPDQVQHLG